nr:hypothetical protein [Neorhizobium tomejilense]
MADIDRALHPDIHLVDDIDTAIGMIVASCDCKTKTDEPRFHDVSCRYRHVATRIEELDRIARTREF